MAIFSSRNLTSSLLGKLNLCRNTRTMCDKPSILLESNQNVGVIILNRPKQLNALNLPMVKKISNALEEWSTTKQLVVIKSAGSKAFCAGGDVRAIAEAANNKDYSVGKTFFKEEYKMNAIIGQYKLPYVALMDGITMGGGVGLSVHGRYRVATENTLFAMPETRIGFFPDVGGSYFLPRLEGYLGLYLGLTGHRLKGADVYNAAIATHYCASARLPELEAELMKCTGSQDILQTLEKFQPDDMPEFTLTPFMRQINELFCSFTLEGIIANLKYDDSDFAATTLQSLNEMSPTSLKITHAEFYKGMKMPLDKCLQMELTMAEKVITTNDFYEGVKSVLIDKGGVPVWKPKKIEDVDQKTIDEFFNEPTHKLQNKL